MATSPVYDDLLETVQWLCSAHFLESRSTAFYGPLCVLCVFLTLPARVRRARFYQLGGCAAFAGLEYILRHTEFFAHHQSMVPRETLRLVLIAFVVFVYFLALVFPIPPPSCDSTSTDRSSSCIPVQGHRSLVPDAPHSYEPLEEGELLQKLAAKKLRPRTLVEGNDQNSALIHQLLERASRAHCDVDSVEFATRMDEEDRLHPLRKHFLFPKVVQEKKGAYLCGHSLGLQHVDTESSVLQDLHKWRDLGVLGHFVGPRPWFNIEEEVEDAMASLVGATKGEVAVMNTLTANLHLLMVSFYRPTRHRPKILIESCPFPSDMVAFRTHVASWGLDPDQTILEVEPRAGEDLLRTEDILGALERDGHQIALVLFSGVQYRTGQLFEIPIITEAAHMVGARVGWDMAHAVGNVPLQLHDWNVDFACWCTYKYLCAGPGNLAGLFVHSRHDPNEIPHFSGWWGVKSSSRFLNTKQLDFYEGAKAWQLSNPVVVGMASLIPSLYEYSNATMDRLREKSLLLTAFLEHLLDRKLMGKVHVITPRDPEQRGSQLSIRIQSSFDGQKLDAKQLEHRLAEFGMIVDKRDPDILRVAPKAIYNSFEDVYRFVSFLAEHLVEEEEEGGGAVVAGSQNTGQGSRRNTRNRGRKNGGGGGDSGSSK